MSFEELIRSPKNRCRYSGLLVSRTFFRAPYQLLKRFPPQNGRSRANFLKTFKKPPGLLISFSRSAERTTFRSGPQKEAFSKVCRKFDTNCTPHSAERTIFSPYDAKNRSVPQKERFLARFSEISRSRPHAEIAQTLEKLAPNDPNWRFPPPPLTQEWRIWTSASTPLFISWCFQPFYVWGGGGGLCLFISRHRLFAPIRLVCCFSCFFLFVFFIHCLFFPSSAALQFEGKGGRKRRTRWVKKKDK